ncbi:MAG TPA: hypothetical protein VKG91_15075 [Roseiarcus sp.]|nr:hypothetical protein [Roseiarcus sp.]
MLERAGTRSPLSIPTVDEIRDRACAFAFGKAVVENSNRGLVAEIIVEAAIGPEWELCSGDWGGWDFEYVSDRARRFEVRQSAALQTWLPSKKPKHPRFDIRVKKGYYKGAEWIPHDALRPPAIGRANDRDARRRRAGKEKTARDLCSSPKALIRRNQAEAGS